MTSLVKKIAKYYSNFSILQTFKKKIQFYLAQRHFSCKDSQFILNKTHKRSKIVRFFSKKIENEAFQLNFRFRAMASTSIKSAIARIGSIKYTELEDLKSVSISQEEQEAVRVELEKEKVWADIFWNEIYTRKCHYPIQTQNVWLVNNIIRSAICVIREFQFTQKHSRKSFFRIIGARRSYRKISNLVWNCLKSLLQ